MRLRLVLIATCSIAIAGASGFLTSPLASASAALGASPPPAATVKVIARPVTSTGTAAAGYHVQAEPTGSVDCSARTPSPGAVSPNIEFCSPSAEFAVACWKSAAPRRVLCIRDPSSHTIVRIPRSGSFAPTAAAPSDQRAPLRLTLFDGDVCQIRAGGAAGGLQGHPKLFATYYCARAGAVWASSSAKHLGVDESASSWTVRTAPPADHSLTLRHVKRAFFVGTKS